jgi:hypothetical protein
LTRLITALSSGTVFPVVPGTPLQGLLRPVSMASLLYLVHVFVTPLFGFSFPGGPVPPLNFNMKNKVLGQELLGLKL